MRIRSALTAICLTAIATGAIPTAVSAAPPAGVIATEKDRKDFRETFAREGGVLIQAIIAQFPAEYRAFEDNMLKALSEGASEEDAGRLAFEFVAGLAPKVFEGWRMAPDAEVVANLRLDLDNATRLSKINATACAEYLEGGLSVESALVLPEKADDIFEKHNASMIRLAKSGRVAQTRRAPVTEAEVGTLIDAYRADGGELRWLTGQSSGDFGGLTPADRCNSGILWAKTMLKLGPAFAARIVTSE